MSQPEYKYATPNDVRSIVDVLETSTKKRGENRALINKQFGGMRPYSDAEVEENQIQINVNFLEGYKIALDGNLQVNGALLSKSRFFNARCTTGPQEKREEWGRKFTEAIHKPLTQDKSGKKHFFLMRNRNASLVLHGIGAMIWHNGFDWMPKFVGLEDLLIPTDAPQDFSDELGHFGVNVYSTPWQIYQMTLGSPANVKDSRWNKELAKKLLRGLKNVKHFTPEIYEQPEKLASLWKEHSLYMNSDAVPKVKLTFFFHQNEKTGKWHRKIIVRENGAVTEALPDEFLYDSDDTVFAEDIDQIIHIQFGDGNVVAPLKFHSVRGLGMLLYAVVELINRLRSQQINHTFEQMMTLLRVQNPQTTDRPKLVNLHPYAVVEDGVTFIPPSERNQADPKFIEFAMAQARQIMSENSSSFVQAIDNGTQREQTLGEAQIKLQSANKIVAGMLTSMYLQESFYWEEVKRRFLLTVPASDEVKTFQQECENDGIPKDIMKPEFWVIDIEKAFGAGDQTLAVQEATQLLGISDKLDPTSKRVVLRKYIATVTRNDDLATLLVPEKKPESSLGTQAAEDVFGTLMLGIPVSAREGIEHQDYVATLMVMMSIIIQGINESDGVGKPEQVQGLQASAASVTQHIEIMSQDPINKEFVTAAEKALSKMMNDVRAFAQRQQQAAEAAAKQQQDAQSAESQAKAQAMMAESQAKIAASQSSMQAKAMEVQQQMALDKAKHDQEMQIEREQHMAEIATMSQKANAEVDALTKKAQAEITSMVQKAQAEIEARAAITAASVEAKKKAEAVKPAGDA